MKSAFSVFTWQTFTVDNMRNLFNNSTMIRSLLFTFSNNIYGILYYAIPKISRTQIWFLHKNGIFDFCMDLQLARRRILSNIYAQNYTCNFKLETWKPPPAIRKVSPAKPYSVYIACEASFRTGKVVQFIWWNCQLNMLVNLIDQCDVDVYSIYTIVALYWTVLLAVVIKMSFQKKKMMLQLMETWWNIWSMNTKLVHSCACILWSKRVSKFSFNPSLLATLGIVSLHFPVSQCCFMDLFGICILLFFNNDKSMSKQIWYALAYFYNLS